MANHGKTRRAAINDPPFLFYLPSGGPWQGDLALGVTHMDHIAHVTNNRIRFVVVGDGLGNFFNGDIYVNGLQLWKIEPLKVDPTIVCGGTSLGSCLEANDHAACSDAICCTAVCQSDSYCCNVEWNHQCDGLVNVADLLILLADWGPCPSGCHCPADLDGSNSVNVSDLLWLLSQRG